MSFREKMIAARAIGSKNYSAAIDSCKRMLRENEEDYFAIALLAYCYEWGDDIANSIIYANKYLARFPNDLDCFCYLPDIGRQAVTKNDLIILYAVPLKTVRRHQRKFLTGFSG